MSEEREVYETEDIEVEPTGNELVPLVGNMPADPNAYIENVEKWMDFLQKIHRVFFKCLNPRTDLCFLGDGNKDVVYLKKPGKDKLLAMSGGELHINSVKREDAEDDGGKWYGYVADVTYTRGDGKKFDASYMVTSRMKLLGVVGGKPRPVEAVLPDNIREASITQATSRAIAKALGVSRFTILQLQEMGVKVELIEGYTYKGTGGQTYGQKYQSAKQPKEKTTGQTDGRNPPRLGDKEIAEIKKYQAKTGAGMGKILIACGNIGYEKLEDVPLSKYEALKKEIKAVCEVENG